ncbi:MAG: TlpA family protein disulfide reductase [Planctomycetes bacterium]|nr:TlpA family protein disulfide reductase [Planctomycetota bacterium]
MRTKTYQLIALIILSTIILAGCDKPTPPQTAQNTHAPDFTPTPKSLVWGFTLQDMNNQEVKLKDLISDKPLVLDFWASWCPTCRAEIPNVVELYNQYKDKITIVGINLDKTFADAQEYTREHNIPYPNLYDAQGMVANFYHVHGIPTIIIINAQGEIVKRDATLNDVQALVK